jgi:alpha-L-fucosidase 2
MWARLLDGEHAHKMVHELLAKSTLPNMLDTCPPMILDANYGGANGILEMLLQSHLGFIDLLPALPSAWPSGSFRGMVARGGFEVGAKWEKGRLSGVSIYSRLGNKCTIRYGDRTAELETAAGKNYELDGDLKQVR